ncbi:GNAT family N-acetyltransferase [Rhizobium leguminosarum bv. viciae]|uniref:GNAT family N-acetyltransferase n=1 Tax=Rhizobium leguminosarum TaxID=384 RepID=UPI0014418DA1|nr:GNAT family N-acetyltransferase [Rhizobium leguminosarum]NKK64223.1 GNAT family N-acetyltransferase [Rhizobium leguminosarum bv. viciae]
MDIPMYSVISKRPSDCSDRELQQFVKLVMAGGEVAKGLPGRVQKAVSLVMLLNGDALVGTAGLKRPETGYQSKVFRRAQTDKAPGKFPFELGWVYIAPDHRGGKRAKPLIKAAVDSSEGVSVFATARQNNEAMHHLLTNAGFVLSGMPYASQQNAGQKIVLFVKDAPGGKAAGPAV